MVPADEQEISVGDTAADVASPANGLSAVSLEIYDAASCVINQIILF